MKNLVFKVAVAISCALIVTGTSIQRARAESHHDDVVRFTAHASTFNEVLPKGNGAHGKFVSTLSEDGTTLNWTGNARLERARFVSSGKPAKDTLEFYFTLRHDLKKHAGTLSRGELRFGKAAASLTGSYADSGKGTGVLLRLAGSAMPVNALTGMLPPLDIQLA